jgi:hypothetical protein
VGHTISAALLLRRLDDLRRASRQHRLIHIDRANARPHKNPFYRRVSRPAEAADALDEVATNKAQVALVGAVGWDRYQRSSPARGAARLAAPTDRGGGSLAHQQAVCHFRPDSHPLYNSLASARNAS